MGGVAQRGGWFLKWRQLKKLIGSFNHMCSNNMTKTKQMNKINTCQTTEVFKSASQNDLCCG